MDKSSQKLAGLVFELSRIIRRMMASQQNDTLNFFHAFTLLLIRDDQGITMKDLAGHLQISSSSATALVDRLVKGKCVQRKSDAANRKWVRLSLTKTGQKALEENYEQRESLLHRGFSRLSAEERKIFEKILRTLIEAYQS